MIAYVSMLMVPALLSPLGQDPRPWPRLLVFWVLVAFLVLFAGLRFETGFDYYTYQLNWYAAAVSLEAIFSQVKEPGLFLLFYPFNHLDLGFAAALLFATTLSIGIKAWVISRWSCNVFLSLTLMVGTLLLLDEMGQIRTALASAALFAATGSIVHGRPLRFTAWWLAGIAFHYSSLAIALAYIGSRIRLLMSWPVIIGLLVLAFGAAMVGPLNSMAAAIDLVIPGSVSYKAYLLRLIESAEPRPLVTLGLLWHLVVFFVLRVGIDRSALPFAGFDRLMSVYFLGILLLVGLSESEAIAGRVSQPFLMFSILLAPYAVQMYKPRELVYLATTSAIVLFAFLRLSLTLFGRADDLVPYQSILQGF